MGAGQSSSSPGPEAEASVAGLGVASLVREIGMAMIPAHLRHTLDSITQIIGESLGDSLLTSIFSILYF